MHFFAWTEIEFFFFLALNLHYFLSDLSLIVGNRSTGE